MSPIFVPPAPPQGQNIVSQDALGWITIGTGIPFKIEVESLDNGLTRYSLTVKTAQGDEVTIGSADA